MILPLVYYGNSKLRQKSLLIEDITPPIEKLAFDMIETMDNVNGIGLAAPQVGFLIRMFVLRRVVIDEKGYQSLKDPEIFINPKIVSYSQEKVLDSEGCVSFPGIYLDIYRPKEIVVEAFDLNNKKFTLELKDYQAREVLHENDHLNGVFFVDRADKKVRKKIDPLLIAIKKKYN